MTTTAYVANTNVLEVRGLKSAIEDAFINDATVSVTVKDGEGVEVAGQSWPAAMAYVTSSDGWYRTIIEDGVDFEADETYYAFIDADAGTDRIGHWEFAFVPKTRRAT